MLAGSCEVDAAAVAVAGLAACCKAFWSLSLAACNAALWSFGPGDWPLGLLLLPVEEVKLAPDSLMCKGDAAW